jgi:hypothetical protein
MLELGQILGLLSAVLLIVAVTAWAKLSLSRAPQAIHGCPVANPGPVEFASRLIVVAFALSVPAAIFAVVGWIGL